VDFLKVKMIGGVVGGPRSPTNKIEMLLNKYIECTLTTKHHV